MQKKIPIDSHSNENFITPFFGPPKAANPKMGEDKRRVYAGYARMQTLARIGRPVVEKSLTEQKKNKKHTVKQIPCPKDGATVLKVGGQFWWGGGQFCSLRSQKKFFDPPLFGQWGDKYCLDSLFCQPNSSV